MFSDFASQSNWSAWWPPLISLLTACHCGWIWALLSEYNGSDDVHIDECNHMTPPLLAISICSMASMLLMTPLRYRQSSLQLFGALMIFIVFTALTLIAILVTISCAIWLATSIPSADASPLCGQRLVATSILTVILSLLLSVFWLVCLFKMTYWRILFLKPPTHAYDNTGSIRWVRTYKRGYFIPTIMYHYHRRSADDNHDPFTLLYSHGNAVDLRDMQYTLSQIADSLGCNVFSYEFVGYGPSGGPVSEDNCYESLHTAYRELRNHYSIPTNRIVLWGRSLGTGPTIQVAAELGLDIAGIILESPLRSIVRTIIPYNCATCWCDVFANQDKVGLIRVPVHIEHGTDDIVVPTAHGQYLHDKLGALSWEPRWWPGIGHNNLPRVWMASGIEGSLPRQGITDGMTVDDMHSEQFRTIRDFLVYLRNRDSSTNNMNTNGLPWPPTPTSQQLSATAAAAAYIAAEVKVATHVTPSSHKQHIDSSVTSLSLPSITVSSSSHITGNDVDTVSLTSVDHERQPLTVRNDHSVAAGVKPTNGIQPTNDGVAAPRLAPNGTAAAVRRSASADDHNIQMSIPH